MEMLIRAGKRPKSAKCLLSLIKTWVQFPTPDKELCGSMSLYFYHER